MLKNMLEHFRAIGGKKNKIKRAERERKRASSLLERFARANLHNPRIFSTDIDL